MNVSDEKELERGKITEVPSPILQGVSCCLIFSLTVVNRRLLEG